jgi:hypothetical protein
VEIRCPYCQTPAGVTTSPATLTCLACRGVFRVTFGEAAPPAPFGASLDSAEPVSPIPWENRRAIGFWRAFRRTTADALFCPGEFFSAVPIRKSDLNGPFLFLLLWLIAGAVAQAVLSIPALYAPIVELPAEAAEKLPRELRDLLPQLAQKTPAALLLSLGCAPLTNAIVTVIVALVMHLGLLVTGGAAGGYETTLRTVFYAAAINAVWPFAMLLFFAAAAVAGGLDGPDAARAASALQGLVAVLFFAWGLPVTIIGLREAHRSTTGQALGALLGFAFIALCCCGVPMAALVAGIAGAAAQGAS